MVWYLVALAWLAVMGAIVYNYTRKQRRRTSARAQDMEKALGELRAAAKMRAADPGPSARDSGVAAHSVPEFTRKPRLLPQPAAVLYYVFKTGLPDHEIFAGVSLSDVLEVAANAQPPQRELLRRKLEQHRLDLIVCTKQFEVVAGIIVADDAAAGGETRQFIDRCMTAAGVRLVRVDPGAPPRHHQVHALVYR